MAGYEAHWARTQRSLKGTLHQEPRVKSEGIFFEKYLWKKTILVLCTFQNFRL